MYKRQGEGGDPPEMVLSVSFGSLLTAIRGKYVSELVAGNKNSSIVGLSLSPLSTSVVFSFCKVFPSMDDVLWDVLYISSYKFQYAAVQLHWCSKPLPSILPVCVLAVFTAPIPRPKFSTCSL